MIGLALSPLAWGAGALASQKNPLGAVSRTLDFGGQERQQNEIIQQALNQGRQDLAASQAQAMGTLTPYMGIGTGAAQQIQGMLGGVNEAQYMAQAQPEFAYDMPSYTTEQFLDPSIQYQIQQAQQGIDASAAARGGLLSGATLKELQSRGMQIGQQGWADAFQRAMAMGQQARADRGFAYQQYADKAQQAQQQAAQRLAMFQAKLGGLGSLASMGAQTAGNIAGLQSDYGQSLANIAMASGTQQANAVPMSWGDRGLKALGVLGEVGATALGTSLGRG
jgi:hypothetical protein